MYDGQDRLMQYGATTFTYTANGEVASKVDGSGVTTYLYDTEGNLLSVTLPNGDEVSYVVDGRNRRIARAVNGVITQQWLYGDQLRIVAELDAVGTVVSRFIYEGSSHSPDLMVRGGVTYRLVKDQVGSVLEVVDAASGAVVQAREYDAWGAVLSDTAPGWQPFGFAGGLWDAQTGLVRFGRRDYDMLHGIWGGKDLLLFRAGSASLYRYSHSNPVSGFDPTGLWVVYAGPQVSAGVGVLNLGGYVSVSGGLYVAYDSKGLHVGLWGSEGDMKPGDGGSAFENGGGGGNWPLRWCCRRRNNEFCWRGI